MRRWQALSTEFDALGVRFIAISPDTPAEVAKLAARESLDMTLLSDESLAVTDRYGLRRDKTLAFGRGRSMIRPLAVPTTILVDREGIVRWIDRSDDFRVRSEASRVLEAVRAALAASG